MLNRVCREALQVLFIGFLIFTFTVPKSGESEPVSSPLISCPGCPVPTPTPKPSQPPLWRLDPTSPLNPNSGYNYHDAWAWFTPTLDVYAQVNISDFGVNISDPAQFTTNEIWRTDNSGSSPYWEEIGYTAGPVSGTEFAGIFGAYYQKAGYYEFPITSNPAQGGAGFYGAGVSLAVELNNNSIVDFNYNNQTWHSVQTSVSSAPSSVIGMESNSSLPQFNAWLGELDIVGPQIYAPGASNWSFWPTNSSSLGYLDDSPPGEAISVWMSSDARYTPNEPHPAFYYQ